VRQPPPEGSTEPEGGGCLFQPPCGGATKGKEMRYVQSRFEADGVVGEWEAADPTHTKPMSRSEARRWVTDANRSAKQAGEYIRYRSLEIDDIFA